MKKLRRGRPAKPSDKRLSKKVLLRVHPLEKQAFAEAGELAGTTMSGWMRDRLRTACERDLGKAGRPVPYKNAND